MAETLTGNEEEDDYAYLDDSDTCCVSCNDNIKMSEEVFLLRIVQPHMLNGQLVHFDVLDATGNFQYEPAFFNFGCWEEEQERLEELVEDVPPVSDAAGLLLCDLCESDIREGERVGLLEFGELNWSDRAPNNQATPVFVAMDDGKHICLACLYRLDTNRVEPLWPDDIEPVEGADICIEGVFERCWRYNNCTCPKRTFER